MRLAFARRGLIKRRLSCAAILLSCALITVGIVAPVVAYAGEIDNVQVPDTLQVAGKTLHLNGYGLRTYSILGIHIYVASLYLEHLSSNPDEIIHSPETKLLNVTFVRDVTADQARKAWRDGFANNCKDPCHLDPNDIERFLAEVPAMRAGDNFSLLFQKNIATIAVGGQQLGTITSPHFAEAMLATFFGPAPASLSLKQALLGDARAYSRN